MFPPLRFRIDVSLTDDRVLQIIRERLGSEPGRMSVDEIARLVGCHPNTARNSIHRLKSAGRLRVERGGGKRKPSRLEITEAIESA